MTNPTLKAFETLHPPRFSEATATHHGTTLKTFLTLAAVVAGAVVTWNLPMGLALLLGMGGLVLGLILALVTVFRPKSAPFTALPYGFCEGLLLGFLTSLLESLYPLIGLQAGLITLALFAVTLAAYQAGWLRATPGFLQGMQIAVGAVMLVYLVGFLGSFWGWQIPYIHEGGIVGIAFSGVVITIATLTLVVDFHIIDQAVAQQAPRHMEWYGAFALTVTLVWMYIEVLHLLSKVRE